MMYKKILLVLCVSIAFDQTFLEAHKSQVPRAERVLVFAPHPDDEIIGCGGTLCKHRDDGSSVKIVYMTSGESAPWNGEPEDLGRIRENEATEGTSKIGVFDLVFLREPDAGLEFSDDLAEKIEDILTQYRPDLIYIPHRYDGHHDHKATFFIVMKIVQSMEKHKPTFKTPLILCYEVWTPLQEITHICDTSRYADTKFEALNEHRSQLAQVNYTEAIKGFNLFRCLMFGALKFPNCSYCECFLKLE